MSQPSLELYLVNGVSLLISLPSVALYLLECAVIVGGWKSTFNSPFYKLFLANAFNVIFQLFIIISCQNLILYFVASFFYSRLLFNWVPRLSFIFAEFPNWLTGFLFILQLYYLYAENSLLLFILVQRLTTILFPFDDKKVFLNE